MSKGGTGAEVPVQLWWTPGRRASGERLIWGSAAGSKALGKALFDWKFCCPLSFASASGLWLRVGDRCVAKLVG